ncbi:hypothetical protein DK419_16020 [Methylobacterium terrae]|uniref:Uncharacterized protein n=1 Tax=Methylobacterium terrae TaxID=2202827 RepID=A0A2U8WR08_9HYPH|nr:hypothetical protein [Methylobacterium terrae]AWN47632.1 hypothetical protein DK419_16020 [Methylobacterium terrae]
MSKEQHEHQPTPWYVGADGVLYDRNGKMVRLSGLGTALNATSIFPKADANRAYMLKAVNAFDPAKNFQS